MLCVVVVVGVAIFSLFIGITVVSGGVGAVCVVGVVGVTSVVGVVGRAGGICIVGTPGPGRVNEGGTKPKSLKNETESKRPSSLNRRAFSTNVRGVTS